MWVYNPNVDLDFLGNDREKLLELWQARLKEEEEDNISLSTSITKDDYIEDASSKSAPRDKSTLEAEIDAMLGDAELAEDPVPQTEEQAAVVRQEIIQIVRETLTEVDSEVQTPPPKP